MSEQDGVRSDCVVVDGRAYPYREIEREMSTAERIAFRARVVRGERDNRPELIEAARGMALVALSRAIARAPRVG